MATEPFNPSKYRGIEDYVCISIVRDRDPTINDIRDPRTGRYYQQNTIWMNEDTESFFALARIVANEAQWIAFGTPSSGLLATLSSNTGDTVTPDGASNIRIIGDTTQGVTGDGVDSTHTITMTVNNATTSTKGVSQFDPDDFVVTDGVVSLAPEVPLTFTTDSGSVQADMNVLKIIGGQGIDTSGTAPNIVTVSGELATAGANVADANIGMAAYNSADFTVIAGFVSLKSGSAAVTSLTGDDSVAVLPTGGNINLNGVAVANYLYSQPLYFKDGGSSTINANIQVSKAFAAPPADKSYTGICTFDSSAFSVSSDGHVTLIGGAGPAVDGHQVDTTSGTGVNPVTANGSGLIFVIGNAVANAANAHGPVTTNTPEPYKFNVEVQASTAISGTPLDINDAGLSSFESSTFSVNSSFGYVDLKNQFLTNSFTNLGLDYSSPTLKVTSADGTALSATNKAWVRIQSQNDRGKMLNIAVEADVSMQDAGGTGDMNSNTFGTTTLIAWSDTLPLFLYAVLNDLEDAVTFALSRVPHLTVAPAAAKMAKQGSAVATTQGSMFVMDSAATVGDYDGNPCVCLGSVIATKSAADAWTLAINNDFVGLGRYADNFFWTFPRDQMGADPAANSCLSSSNGADTVPSFVSNGRSYTISRDGLCNFVWGWNNISAAGVGTGTLRLHIPFQNGTTGATFPSNFSWINGGGTYTTGQFRFPNVASYMEFLYHGTSITNVTPGDITGKTNGTAGAVFFVLRS